MIPRPMTDDLIADCCRELTEHILPALTDETLQVRLVMTETVLRNAAVRAAHEIAWLREETGSLVAYARTVSDRLATPQADTALAAVDEGPRDSLHLADVVAVYDLSGLAFDAALAAAQDARADDLVAAARDLLRARIDREKVVMATYAVVGR